MGSKGTIPLTRGERVADFREDQCQYADKEQGPHRLAGTRREMLLLQLSLVIRTSESAEFPKSEIAGRVLPRLHGRFS
jgi:hypothetical protein